MKKSVLILSVHYLFVYAAMAQKVDLGKIKSPILFAGNEKTAFRDPAVLYEKGVFYLYFTLTEIEPDNKIYMYTAFATSKDLIHWSKPLKITVKDQSKNYSSPGNIIKKANEWILCLQTYPRPGYTAEQMPKYGNRDSRLYTMRSNDLKSWTKPELIKVKGDQVPSSDMGRMIDPYIVEDKDETGKYWCFYKQNGVSMSYSHDLLSWTYFGSTESGENVCVLREKHEYILFHSPPNGIGIKKSSDLKTWQDWGSLITLDQKNWDWAKGRITAGTVLDLRNVKGIGKYVMFFHGSGPYTEKQGDFDKNASIGIAWSYDLEHWNWPLPVK